jgi:transposase
MGLSADIGLPGETVSKKPPLIELDADKTDAFLKRAREVLEPRDFAFVSSLLGAVSYLNGLVHKKSRSIGRLLHMMFGATTESSERILKKKTKDEGSGVAKDGERRTAKGHGRNGAQDYTGAPKVDVTHDCLKNGDKCPGCGRGKLYRIDPGILMNLFAASPIQAIIYMLEKLRCNLCGGVYTAEKPPEAKEPKYDETVGSMVGLLRYGYGLPFNRTDKLQAGCGIPLPSSTQWEIVHQSAQELRPAFEQLIQEGAQAENIYQDDTNMKILSSATNKKEDEKTTERTGTFTTGLVCESKDKTIACFFTGTKHAGENLRELLQQRLSELPPPNQMCDALSRNMPEDLKTIIGNCMSHARRNFVDQLNAFPEVCRFVIEALAKIYRHDALAKEDNMSPVERLKLHQEKSGPVMDELKGWMEAQLNEKKVEPNSGAGKAMTYMLTRWPKFTLFLRVPGAAIDNNVCERALKMAIRHRTNSLFYRSERGAWVGDLFMSLIHTCNLMKVNAFEYLTTLLRNTGRLSQNPGGWMPWNYKQTLSDVPP